MSDLQDPKNPVKPVEPKVPSKDGIIEESYSVMSAMLKIARDNEEKLTKENKELTEMVAKMTQIIEDEQKSELISHLMRSTSIPPEYLATMKLDELKEAKKYTDYKRPTTFVSGAAVASDEPRKPTLDGKFEESMAMLKAGKYR